MCRIPDDDELEEWRDGEKWVLVKNGRTIWVKESECGTYRLTDRGYESRDPDGKWVSYAQMPADVSHLTQAQIERLVKELRGDIKVSLKEEDPTEEGFVPKAKVPPLEKWPFYRIPITDDVVATDEDLKGFQELEMTEDLGRAFFLSSRWKLANEARRHLGYNVNDDIEDIAYLNGCVLALRCMVEQLKRLSKFRKKQTDEPSDAARLRSLRLTGLLGTDRGSSIAMWLYNPKSKVAAADIVIGDDGMCQGPKAEEACLRLLARRGKELGAETLWCRTRRTESARVFVPKYMKKMGFTPVPPEEQEEQEWEIFEFKEKVEVEEKVQNLRVWLAGRGLEAHLDAVNAWCEEMGALELAEVVENSEDIIEYLGDALTEEDKERLRAD